MGPRGDEGREGSGGETRSLGDRAEEARTVLRRGGERLPQAGTLRAPTRSTVELLGLCHRQLAEQT